MRISNIIILLKKQQLVFLCMATIKGVKIMEKSKENQPMPIEVDLKKGEKYYWCACGKTADEPFCDGSHEGDISYIMSELG